MYRNQYHTQDLSKYQFLITGGAGFTSNLSSRFEAHQKGKVKSTKYRRPFKLIYFEGCLSQKDALKREKYLKTHYGKMFLGNRLKSYFTSQVEDKSKC